MSQQKHGKFLDPDGRFPHLNGEGAILQTFLGQSDGWTSAQFDNFTLDENHGWHQFPEASFEIDAAVDFDAIQKAFEEMPIGMGGPFDECQPIPTITDEECEDEGCPHFGTPHGHVRPTEPQPVTDWDKQKSDEEIYADIGRGVAAATSAAAFLAPGTVARLQGMHAAVQAHHDTKYGTNPRVPCVIPLVDQVLYRAAGIEFVAVNHEEAEKFRRRHSTIFEGGGQ